MARSPVTPVPGKPETLPPRAEVVRAFLPGRKMVKIQFDPNWGASGGWFDERNHAISERAIVEWCPNR